MVLVVGVMVLSSQVQTGKVLLVLLILVVEVVLVVVQQVKAQLVLVALDLLSSDILDLLEIVKETLLLQLVDIPIIFIHQQALQLTLIKMTQIDDIRRLRSDFEMHKVLTDDRLDTLTKAIKRLEMILIGSAGSTILLLISLVIRS